MNNTKISLDDPRLTAFALGELEPAEHVAVAAAIKDDPGAQAFVEQIRALGGELSVVLAKEPLPVVAKVENKAGEGKARADYRSQKVVAFPYFIVAGLAAACFAVMWVNLQRKRAASELEIARFERTYRAKGIDSIAVERKAKGKESGGPLGVLEVSLGDDVHTVAMPASSLGALEVNPEVAESAKKFNTEAYADQADNAYLAVAENPLSTFSIDVDTASYSNLRRFLKGGQRPPRDAVRIEELVNYFPYRYAAPKDAATPFAASMEVASAPWNPTHRLVRIGLKGRELSPAERPALKIAKDVKLQVEFNPAKVKSYRLIGYENRMLRKEDFNNDKIDAGEIGAGHTVTDRKSVV